MVALRPARPVVFSPLTPGRLFADSVESAPLRRRTSNAFNLCELDVSDPHHAHAVRAQIAGSVRGYTGDREPLRMVVPRIMRYRVGRVPHLRLPE